MLEQELIPIINSVNSAEVDGDEKFKTAALKVYKLLIQGFGILLRKANDKINVVFFESLAINLVHKFSLYSPSCSELKSILSLVIYIIEKYPDIKGNKLHSLFKLGYDILVHRQFDLAGEIVFLALLERILKYNKNEYQTIIGMIEHEQTTLLALLASPEAIKSGLINIEIDFITTNINICIASIHFLLKEFLEFSENRRDHCFYSLLEIFELLLNKDPVQAQKMLLTFLIKTQISTKSMRELLDKQIPVKLLIDIDKHYHQFGLKLYKKIDKLQSWEKFVISLKAKSRLSCLCNDKQSIYKISFIWNALRAAKKVSNDNNEISSSSAAWATHILILSIILEKDKVKRSSFFLSELGKSWSLLRNTIDYTLLFSLTQKCVILHDNQEVSKNYLQLLVGLCPEMITTDMLKNNIYSSIKTELINSCSLKKSKCIVENLDQTTEALNFLPLALKFYNADPDSLLTISSADISQSSNNVFIEFFSEIYALLKKNLYFQAFERMKKVLFGLLKRSNNIFENICVYALLSENFVQLNLFLTLMDSQTDYSLFAIYKIYRLLRFTLLRASKLRILHAIENEVTSFISINGSKDLNQKILFFNQASELELNLIQGKIKEASKICSSLVVRSPYCKKILRILTYWCKNANRCMEIDNFERLLTDCQINLSSYEVFLVKIKFYCHKTCFETTFINFYVNYYIVEQQLESYLTQILGASKNEARLIDDLQNLIEENKISMNECPAMEYKYRLCLALTKADPKSLLDSQEISKSSHAICFIHWIKHQNKLIFANNTGKFFFLDVENSFLNAIQNLKSAIKFAETSLTHCNSSKLEQDVKLWWKTRVKADKMIKKAILTVETEIILQLSTIFQRVSLVSKAEANLSQLLKEFNVLSEDEILYVRLAIEVIKNYEVHDNQVCVFLNTFLPDVKHKERLISHLMEYTNLGSAKRVTVNLVKAFDALHVTSDMAKSHIQLHISENLLFIPFESFRCFKDTNITRINFTTNVETTCSKLKGLFVVDPENNLSGTTKRLQPIATKLSNKYGWDVVMNRTPDSNFILKRLKKNIYLYSGHGSGERILSIERFKNYYQKENMVPPGVIILMGCSSGKINLTSPSFVAEGIVKAYLNIGASIVICCQWDVSDKDIDRFTLSLVEELMRTSNRSIQSCILRAKNACRLKHAVGSSIFCYGSPTYTT